MLLLYSLSTLSLGITLLLLPLTIYICAYLNDENESTGWENFRNFIVVNGVFFFIAWFFATIIKYLIIQ